ncbi:MAG: hypothetical protein DYH12_13095 [Sorangiineae bacterium PRO1]|nr:hypothetical protein [Sorangiineae bacterium PRO1]
MRRWPLALFALLVSAELRAEPGTSELGPGVLKLPVLERKAEQGILTPVPITVTLPVELAARAARVLVHYRVWGDPDWTTLALSRRGKAWTGAIPCLEVSTITGDVRYYVRVHDAEGSVLASAGSRVRPFKVTVLHDTMLGGGAPKKARCPDPSDCPRGLPGCPSEAVKEIPCKSDRDCEGASTCSWRGFCELVPRKRSWLSLGVEQDLGLVSTTGACSIQAQENEGTACFRESDGANYASYPVYTNEPLGPARGPTRLLIGYERVVYYDTSFGLRAGMAVAGEGPTLRGAAAFVPWSLSLRATRWFGEDPFAHAGWRPYAFLTAGYAQFDLVTSVSVREDPTRFSYQGDNDLEQDLELWKRAGDGFAGIGAGLAFAPTGDTMLGAELALVQVFPFSATVITPTLSCAVGF